MQRFLVVTLLFSLALSISCAGEEEVPETAVPAEVAAPSTGEEALASPSPVPEVGESETEGAPADPFVEEREELIQTGIIGFGIEDPAVIQAMRDTPRHAFVPDEYLGQAYNNHPLPIGFGQTISQPYIVALMTEAAEIEAGDTILEVGTGSGYQAAVLAEVAGHVYTVEIIGALAERAEATLEELGYDNVTVRHADGYFGWPEHAPFDAIVVTAAPDHIPQPLVEQLKEGGKMIIPVGPVGGYQTLWQVTKVGEDEIRTVDLGGVQFVPFTREER